MTALTPEQASELRADLLALDRELRKLLDGSEDAAAPVDLDQPIGRISRIDAIQQQSMVQANRRATQRRLQQVEAALRRLAEDEYGACASCGEDVGRPRLKARPETPFCIACQTERESR